MKSTSRIWSGIGILRPLFSILTMLAGSPKSLLIDLPASVHPLPPQKLITLKSLLVPFALGEIFKIFSWLKRLFMMGPTSSPSLLLISLPLIHLRPFKIPESAGTFLPCSSSETITLSLSLLIVLVFYYV